MQERVQELVLSHLVPAYNIYLQLQAESTNDDTCCWPCWDKNSITWSDISQWLPIDQPLLE